LNAPEIPPPLVVTRDRYILHRYGINDTHQFDTLIATAIRRGSENGVFELPKGFAGKIKIGRDHHKEVRTYVSLAELVVVSCEETGSFERKTDKVFVFSFFLPFQNAAPEATTAKKSAISGGTARTRVLAKKTAAAAKSVKAKPKPKKTVPGKSTSTSTAAKKDSTTSAAAKKSASKAPAAKKAGKAAAPPKKSVAAKSVGKLYSPGLSILFHPET
jgi:hypothetical protein